ncbi:MAG TPA: AraC family ligand binding domain-containing protein [Lapillicoccus sp.]|nr:AraC family ligand binding domain-containing protein [Lapillicoccus sp.]
MPQLIPAPTRIPVPGGKVIDEYVGVVNTPQTMLPSSVSVAHMNAPADWSEPFQAPEFGEVTVVLRGTVLVEHDGGRLEVGEGQAVVTAPGERVRYSTGAAGAEYVAVCLPAFTPEAAHRDDE